MIARLRSLLLTGTALKAFFSCGIAGAQEAKLLWVPSKIGSNAYRVKSGVGWRDSLSAGPEFSINANRYGAVYQTPLVMWGEMQLRSSAPFGGENSTSLETRFHVQKQETTIGHSTNLSWMLTPHFSLTSTTQFSLALASRSVWQLRAEEVIRLRMPEKGMSAAVTGSFKPDKYQMNLVVDKTVFPGLSTKATVRDLQADPAVSFRIRYDRRW